MLLTLHRCPPLRSWISVAQCERNAAKGARAARAPAGDWRRIEAFDEMRECPTCPGVVALRAEPPRHVPEAVLRRASERFRTKPTVRVIACRLCGAKLRAGHTYSAHRSVCVAQTGGRALV